MSKVFYSTEAAVTEFSTIKDIRMEKACIFTIRSAIWK